MCRMSRENFALCVRRLEGLFGPVNLSEFGLDAEFGIWGRKFLGFWDGCIG
jgi:hypothetical protein